MDALQDAKYFNAKIQVRKIKGFYTHLSVYIAVNLLIILSNLNDGEGIFNLDNYWTAICWGIGLLAHASSVFVPGFLFGKNWEERKIHEIMERK